MRALAFGLVLLGTAVGFAVACGSSTDDGPNSGSAGTGTGGSSSSAGTSTGKAGEDAKAGASSAGSATGGSSHGGSASGGTPAGGSATGGKPSAQAGSGNDGGAGGDLVDCDPTKITCKRAAPTCGANEVPSVDGSCYGDCVKIDRCACSTAAQCPDQNQYTCWAKQHCGAFVQ